jgi:hypothetical protein
MVQCKQCEKSVHRECDEAFTDMVPYKCANCRVRYKHEVGIHQGVLLVFLCIAIKFCLVEQSF